MKRKLLSVLLTFCLAFSLLPTAALAEGEGAPAPAEVPAAAGIVLPEAADGVITLDNGAYVMSGDTTATIKVPNGKNATLDLNGKTLTNKTGEHTIIVENGATLTITGNGIVDNVSHGKAAVYNEGTVTLAGGTFKRSVEKGTYSPYSGNGNSWYTIANYGTMEINIGVTVENAGGYSSMIRNGSDRVTANCYLTIKGGNFAGGINTVKNDRFGVLTINGGNFSNTAQYVIMNWNKAEITAGTFQTLDTASAVLFTSAYDSDANTVGNLTISGGEFKRASDTQEMIVDHYDASNSGTATVTGGKFDADISAYVPNGYIQNENGAVETLGETNAVAKVGGTYYKTLAEAINAASNGATITLLKDVTEKVSISKNLVLDLNGKTLTGKDLVNSNRKKERIALTANAGEVKVKNGIIDGRVNAYDSANLTIDADVTVKNSYNGSGYDCFGIVVWGDGIFDQEGCKTPKLTVNGKVIMEKGGVAISTNGNDKSCAIVTINNGAVISTTEDGAIYLPSGKLTMNGGTVSGPTGIQICAGSTNITSEFKLHNGTVIATGADERTSKGTGDGLIPDGAAISVVNRNYPNGVPSVTIDGGSFSSANSDAVLAYSWSNGAASEWTDAKTYVKINDGYFTSDPTAYLAADHYVWASDKDGYAYMVKDTAPTDDQKITVVDKTNASVDPSITGNDKTAIDSAMSSGKTNVDGVAEAVSTTVKTGIVNDAKNKANNVPTGEVTSTEIEVKVNVSVTEANLSEGSMTFKAEPVANVKVNGIKLQDSGNKPVEVPVSNAMLNGKPITVKLPLPTVGGKLFTPEQIKHISSDGSVEYFLKTAKRGAKTFEIKDDCAVFKITKFSTFELSGKVTYVAPSYYSGSSSYDPTYSVSTPSKTENGSVTVSPKSASKGDTVTVTVKPDSGYVLETLTVTDKNGNELTLKDKGNGKYTFTMPAGKVEVKATFMEDNSVLNFFYDVPNGAYFCEAVKWAVDKGITNGLSDTMFGPYESCTRAQIVTFLWRATGSPVVNYAMNMSDVPEGSYYAEAVRWALSEGITTGTTENTFSPDSECTRAQAVAFLFRYAASEAVTLQELVSGFSDADSVPGYALPAMNWALAEEIVQGNGSKLMPNDSCTRAQIVTFLFRAYQGK